MPKWYNHGGKRGLKFSFSHCIVTMNPPHPNLIINGHSLGIHLNFLVCCSIKKLTFEKHIRFVASSKCLSIYDSHSILQNCFFSFILPLFEYCAPVWRSVAETHLKLLDRSFNMVKFLLPKIVTLLGLYHFLKIIPQRNTRLTVNQNDCFHVDRCSTEQFSLIFVPYSVRV